MSETQSESVTSTTEAAKHDYRLRPPVQTVVWCSVWLANGVATSMKHRYIELAVTLALAGLVFTHTSRRKGASFWTMFDTGRKSPVDAILAVILAGVAASVLTNVHGAADVIYGLAAIAAVLISTLAYVGGLPGFGREHFTTTTTTTTTVASPGA